MKRYDLDGFENGITEKADGWLVYYDDVQEIEAENTRLKELNREMVYALNLARPFLPPHGGIGKTFNRVLAKTEGRGE